jgi:dihydrolipoamide dehydrogenase
MPSKTLLRPAEALAAARRTPGARDAVVGRPAVEAVLAWRDRIVHHYDDSSYLPWLEERGIELLRGVGRIARRGVVDVDGQTYEAEHVVVATGSAPVIPPIEGLRELEGLWTNREVTGLKAIPESVLVLGGGPVGVEMAQFLVRMGASVILVEGGPRLLAREAPALGEAAARILREDDVGLRLGVHAVRAWRDNRGFGLALDDGSQLRGEKLVVATGRRPRVDGLGLEAYGLGDVSKGVPVDERLRAADGLWAIGDVSGIMPFTHVGKYHGRLVARSILGEDVRADHSAVPRVVFLDPQVAAVGASEGRFSGRNEIASVPRAYTYEDDPRKEPGFLTLVSDGEVLTGAYAVGAEAGEWLQQATLAIRARVPLGVLRDTIQPFPTFSEIYTGAIEQLVKAARG